MLISRRDVARALEEEFGCTFTVEINGYGYDVEDELRPIIKRRIELLEKIRSEDIRKLNESNRNLSAPVQEFSWDARIESDLDHILWIKQNYDIWNDDKVQRIRTILENLVKDVQSITREEL